jgi:hypothetical protein
MNAHGTEAAEYEKYAKFVGRKALSNPDVLAIIGLTLGWFDAGVSSAFSHDNIGWRSECF